MAHECPECGQVCYCNGDIDDCVLNFEEDVMRCKHWEQCGLEEFVFDDLEGKDDVA